MKLWWMAFEFFTCYFSPSRVHIGNLVHLQRQCCKQQPKSLIFFATLLTKYNRNKMLFTTFKENAELVLLDSIAAAVESQTIITCEQLRNISNLII